MPASHLKPGPARSRQQPRHPIVCAHATDRKQRRRSRTALLKGATNSGRTVAEGAEQLRCSLPPGRPGRGTTQAGSSSIQGTRRSPVTVEHIKKGRSDLRPVEADGARTWPEPVQRRRAERNPRGRRRFAR
jgi:hypothetical protein